METGLGQLGFWLAVGIVIAAMIVSGAIKERDRERDRQATLRADLETKQATRQALLERAGENMTEVLAYLRERDATAAAHAERGWRRSKVDQRRGMAFAAAVVVGIFSFMGGLVVLAAQDQHPASPHYIISAETNRLVLQPPPVPLAGWAATAPLGVTLGIWAMGLIVAGLICWFAARQKNDVQPDA